MPLSDAPTSLCAGVCMGERESRRKRRKRKEEGEEEGEEDKEEEGEEEEDVVDSNKKISGSSLVEWVVHIYWIPLPSEFRFMQIHSQ